VRLNEDNLAFLAPDKAGEFSRSLARVGDLIFTCWGTVGQVGLIDSRATFPEYIVSNKQMKLTPDLERADPLFLYYLLSSPAMVEQVQQRAIGAAVPGFNLGQLRELPVCLPPVAEQHAIAATLGALDDKIDSNRRSQVVGQSLVRALVDQAMATSDGPVGVLSDYCHLVVDPVSAADIGPETPYISMGQMPRGSIFVDSWEQATRVSSGKSRFEKDDVLFGKLRPYFRKVGVAPISGVCTTELLVIRPDRASNLPLVACVASSDALIDSLSASATGTRMPRASWGDLAKWPVAMLSADEQDDLGSVTVPLLQKLMQLTIENHRLVALRNVLLPELLSGRLRLGARCGGEH